MAPSSGLRGLVQRIDVDLLFHISFAHQGQSDVPSQISDSPGPSLRNAQNPSHSMERFGLELKDPRRSQRCIYQPKSGYFFLRPPRANCQRASYGLQGWSPTPLPPNVFRLMRNMCVIRCRKLVMGTAVRGPVIPRARKSIKQNASQSRLKFSVGPKFVSEFDYISKWAPLFSNSNSIQSGFNSCFPNILAVGKLVGEQGLDPL